MGWGTLYVIGVTATLCVGGPMVFARSPDPIDPPDPKRMVVTARPVKVGEFIVYDPLAVRFGASRPLPASAAVPAQRRVAIRARLESIYLALPVRMRAIVSARMDNIDIAVPEPRGIRTAAQKDSLDPPLPDQLAVDIALHITPAELEMPALHRLGAIIRRHTPEVILITEPLAMSAAIERRTAPAFVRLRE